MVKRWMAIEHEKVPVLNWCCHYRELVEQNTDYLGVRMQWVNAKAIGIMKCNHSGIVSLDIKAMDVTKRGDWELNFY